MMDVVERDHSPSPPPLHAEELVEKVRPESKGSSKFSSTSRKSNGGAYKESRRAAVPEYALRGHPGSPALSSPSHVPRKGNPRSTSHENSNIISSSSGSSSLSAGIHGYRAERLNMVLGGPSSSSGGGGSRPSSPAKLASLAPTRQLLLPTILPVTASTSHPHHSIVHNLSSNASMPHNHGKSNHHPTGAAGTAPARAEYSSSLPVRRDAHGHSTQPPLQASGLATVSASNGTNRSSPQASTPPPSRTVAPIDTVKPHAASVPVVSGQATARAEPPFGRPIPPHQQHLPAISPTRTAASVTTHNGLVAAPSQTTTTTTPPTSTTANSGGTQPRLSARPAVTGPVSSSGSPSGGTGPTTAAVSPRHVQSSDPKPNGVMAHPPAAPEQSSSNKTGPTQPPLLPVTNFKSIQHQQPHPASQKKYGAGTGEEEVIVSLTSKRTPVIRPISPNAISTRPARPPTSPLQRPTAGPRPPPRTASTSTGAKRISPSAPPQKQSEGTPSVRAHVPANSNRDHLEESRGDGGAGNLADSPPAILTTLPSFGQAATPVSSPTASATAVAQAEKGMATAPKSSGRSGAPQSGKLGLRTSLVYSTALRQPFMEADEVDARPTVPTPEETATLTKYLGERDLNLSMSTFSAVGPTLALSNTLRALSLKGSTLTSEGLRGLADIVTLESICVSHMRRLTSLVPLITCSRPGAQFLVREIDAQCTPLRNTGIIGLDKLPQLRQLDLSMTTLNDVSCLSGSRSLVDLNISVTPVDNVGIVGLEQIPTLRVLNMYRTRITALGRLVQSNSIETMCFYSCKIDDEGIKGIERMPRLAHVDLSTTKVTDLSVLRSSRALKSVKGQWLSLKNCRDIIHERRSQIDRAGSMDPAMTVREMEAGYAGLADIPTLELVDLSFNTIRSVTSLCNSRSLRHLILRRTRVEAAGMTQLRRLAPTLESLVITNLSDILGDEEEEEDEEGSGLEQSTSGTLGVLTRIDDIELMRKLVTLDLSFTDVFDLRMLQHLPLLRELVIVETLVTVEGLRGIEQIPTLEVLDVSQTSVLSLQFLAGGAKSLKKLYARSNRNTRGFRLGHIEALPSLQTLDISDTVVEDVRMMWKATWRLRELIWRWGERREATGPVNSLECWVNSDRLRGLDTMPQLRLLDITNSMVMNLDFLADSKSIHTVKLSGCQLLRNPALRALTRCPGLESIDLSNVSAISDVVVLHQCQRLRELRLRSTGVTVEGLGEVPRMPTLKSLDLTKTPAEEHMPQAGSNEALHRGSIASHGRRSRSSLREQGGAKAGRADGASSPATNPTATATSAAGPDVSPLEMTLAPEKYRVPRRCRVNFVVMNGNKEV